MGLMVISADDGHLLMFGEGVYEFHGCDDG